MDDRAGTVEARPLTAESVLRGAPMTTWTKGFELAEPNFIPLDAEEATEAVRHFSAVALARRPATNASQPNLCLRATSGGSASRTRIGIEAAAGRSWGRPASPT